MQNHSGGRIGNEGAFDFFYSLGGRGGNGKQKRTDSEQSHQNTSHGHSAPLTFSLHRGLPARATHASLPFEFFAMNFTEA